VLGVTFAFSIELTALRLVPAKAVSVFFSFDPVVAFVIGLVMLGQHLTWQAAAGSAAIVLASVMVALHTRSETETALT
jgi:inner membrane transporter RhtA